MRNSPCQELKHPNQPVHLDARGILWFKQNEIVRYLLDGGPFDMNQLAALPFSEDDRNQFAQLLGYSVDGFAELSYADPARVEWADRQGSVL